MTVQGANAILFFFKGSTWLPFLCASDISFNIDIDEIAIRTMGDGPDKKFAYQSRGYNITLSGLLKFDDANYTGSDIIDAVKAFANVQFRITFDDLAGNVKSIQGTAIVKSAALGISVGALVKNDFTLLGNGAFQWFNGDVSCDTVITDIAASGTTSSDGTVTITYTYTGPVYQVMYQVDGAGSYVSTLADVPIVLPTLSNGSHSINIIPLCQNGNEGTGSFRIFSVAHSGATCDLLITGITQDSTTITPVFTGTDTPSTYQYQIDGGSFITKNLLPTTDPIDITGLSLGDHSINIIPSCSDGIEGSGFSDTFTITTSPSNSVINYSFINDPFSGNQMWIYVDGILQVNLTAAGSGSITVSVGQLVKGVLQCTASGGARGVGLRTTNQTTSVILNDQTGRSPQLFQYTFTADGSTYLIGGVISP